MIKSISVVDTGVSVPTHDGTTGDWTQQMTLEGSYGGMLRVLFSLYTNLCARAVFQMSEVAQSLEEVCLLLLDSGGKR